MAKKLGKKSGNPRLMVDRDDLLVDGSDSTFRQFIYDTIAFTARMKTVLDGHARIVDLPPPQYIVLASIIHLSSKQDVNIKTISDHLHISGSFVTTSVGALVKQGLVKKLPDSLDRRRVCLKETKEARDRVGRLEGVQNRVNNTMFETLSHAEFVMLSGIMSRLLNSAERSVSLLSHLESEARHKP